MTAFPFRDVPIGVSGRASRPVLDVVVAGVGHAPQACLIDTGALAVRMSAEIADAFGIDLGEDEPMRIRVGGGTVEAREANVPLTITVDGEAITWEAAVWFCEPWTPAFGLLGLVGFLDRFDLEISGFDGTFSLTSRLEG